MKKLNPVLAGPILRRTNPQHITLWLATSLCPSNLQLAINNDDVISYNDFDTEQVYKISNKLWIIQFHTNLLTSQTGHLGYNVVWRESKSSVLNDNMFYSSSSWIDIILSDKSDHILHGSCRNPHHHSEDSLLQVDSLLDQLATSTKDDDRPDLLLLTGDQIYADHVAGPMLVAIHKVIKLLELPNESFIGAPVENADELYHCTNALYSRDQILPHYQDETHRLKGLINKNDTPIFSSRECENHLISFSEFLAMYLLNWSPVLWDAIQFNQLRPNDGSENQPLLEKDQPLWNWEKAELDKFVAGLPKVRRVMAHVPSYMIFDDHDVTDDWNLTVGWEKAAYENAFSKRIIGNALLSYLLCQAWGNTPVQMKSDWRNSLVELFSYASANKIIAQDQHDDLITQLLRYEKWHFSLDSSPKVVVLDTRTRRWRSESNLNKPSGLMDWEAMVEFQQELIGLDSVVVVSPAPMFGVKFIETLQSMATKMGNPLIIDAENWMAHPGSANTLLSIFTHTKTPKNFVILSGDVHYSFVYDVKLRYKQTDSHIYQITCSGIKNEFPEPLLTICDTLDKWLYSPRSPLNLFTKRKRLKIFKRKPEPSHHNRLVNKSGIGKVRLDDEGKPIEISVLHGDGTKTTFPETNSES
ncbi:alkaline phosphatase D family protein [Vibrio sp. La 4.2.2]|uniref:alkaline phosphatase D family protein n=1 Tax=Vibrio sp. La 4.2.2 TaxID=2998830 RepID=UPI0022CE1D1D|nr:alkaline phosphatase D family protein [Vibrio sp. La 4.2.2]MDA0111360.1 alkaline phosphatase D family protein [Vibrio sp. La 4.2.2]